MTNNHPSSQNMESQNILNQIVLDYMREQKRKRRWRWVVRASLLGILAVVLVVLFTESRADKVVRTQPHVGLIDIKDGIFENQSGSSADSFSKSMKKAYNNTGLKALILRINSPGGSPVQADYMFNLVQYYRQKYPNIKTYAVCVDMCASAAYYVAVAADEIYANPSSLVGSIGVLYNGFGFVDGMQKIGVTRRLQIAGRNKGFLDPFLPENKEQAKTLQVMLDIIHQQFINKVKQGRGSRLKIDDDTFSGLFWTGVQAKERGLIDGFASSGQLAREMIKIDKIVDYSEKPSVLEQFTKNIGVSVANQLPSALGFRPGIQ